MKPEKMASVRRMQSPAKTSNEREQVHGGLSILVALNSSCRSLLVALVRSTIDLEWIYCLRIAPQCVHSLVKRHSDGNVYFQYEPRVSQVVSSKCWCLIGVELPRSELVIARNAETTTNALFGDADKAIQNDMSMKTFYRIQYLLKRVFV